VKVEVAVYEPATIAGVYDFVATPLEFVMPLSAASGATWNTIVRPFTACAYSSTSDALRVDGVSYVPEVSPR
jgi:hypothetical protein